MRYPSLEIAALENLERATWDNFDARGYLLANPDIAAWARAGGDPRHHFEKHGLDEGRQQVSSAFLNAAATRRRSKYERFKHIFDPARGSAGSFRFVESEGVFPVMYGDGTHDLAEYQSESAHGGLGQFDDEIERNPDKLYAEIGCGYRPDVLENCLYVEVYPSRTADIVMSPSCLYPIADASLDGIGCFAVLEHVTEPWIVAAEFRRIVKPGGLLFIDWPHLAPVHGYPSHYYNATQEGLKRMFSEGFDLLELDTRNNQTPNRAVSWILRGWTEGLTDPDIREEMLNMSVRQLIAEPPNSPLWKRVNAATPADVKATYAAGNTLVARRTE